LKSHAVPAAGRQRREGAKNEREKEHVVAEVLRTFHQFGEFSFPEISQYNFAALRLCVRLNRISGTEQLLESRAIAGYIILRQLCDEGYRGADNTQEQHKTSPHL
jgi:hypothetical protein